MNRLAEECPSVWTKEAWKIVRVDARNVVWVGSGCPLGSNTCIRHIKHSDQITISTIQGELLHAPASTEELHSVLRSMDEECMIACPLGWTDTSVFDCSSLLTTSFRLLRGFVRNADACVIVLKGDKRSEEESRLLSCCVADQMPVVVLLELGDPEIFEQQRQLVWPNLILLMPVALLSPAAVERAKECADVLPVQDKVVHAVARQSQALARKVLAYAALSLNVQRVQPNVAGVNAALGMLDNLLESHRQAATSSLVDAWVQHIDAFLNTELANKHDASSYFQSLVDAFELHVADFKEQFDVIAEGYTTAARGAIAVALESLRAHGCPDIGIDVGHLTRPIVRERDAPRSIAFDSDCAVFVEILDAAPFDMSAREWRLADVWALVPVVQFAYLYFRDATDEFRRRAIVRRDQLRKLLFVAMTQVTVHRNTCIMRAMNDLSVLANVPIAPLEEGARRRLLAAAAAAQEILDAAHSGHTDKSVAEESLLDVGLPTVDE